MLSVKDVLKAREQRQKDRQKIFDVFIRRASERVKTAVRMNPDITCVVYTIPDMLFGLPLYNVHECINHIQEQFMKTGFDVRVISPNSVIIDWTSAATAKKQVSYKPTYQRSTVYNQSMLDSIDQYNSNFRK